MSNIDGVGRPLKFKDVAELEKAIDAYFASLYDYARDMWGNRLKDKDYRPKEGDDPDTAPFVMKKVKVATVTGLAIALDTSRKVLLDYENGKYDNRDEQGKPTELTDEQLQYNLQVDQFSNTIKRAKQMILEDTEQQLYKPGRATGAIFSLKVNYEWQDKNVTELLDPDGVLNPYGQLTTEELKALAQKGQ